MTEKKSSSKNQKVAVYAGSFDPWTLGHQYVLQSALKVFDCVHVVAAVNPMKKEWLSPLERARIIAHALDPLTDWWQLKAPFHVANKVIVTATTGLIAQYAREHNVLHLIRGLRSTTDFEAEFNLYFSNRAIHDELESWAIMCPPELLHCSSTYVKSVIGREGVSFVGTCFLAQCAMLQKPFVCGKIFDFLNFVALEKGLKGDREFQKHLQHDFWMLVNKDEKSLKNKVTKLEQGVLKKIYKNGASEKVFQDILSDVSEYLSPISLNLLQSL